jgi:phosphohistidine phosphatase
VTSSRLVFPSSPSLNATRRDDAGMRRRLLLVRHAKSAWDDSSLADHDRPLAPRGAKALLRLRDHVARGEHRPELVLCSSSRRTVDTLDGIQAAVAKRARVEVDEELYLASADILLARLHSIDGDVRCAMFIGHNPGIEDLALLLVGSGNAALREQLAVKFPTGAAATLSFEGSWAGVRAGAARLEGLFVPRPPRVR